MSSDRLNNAIESYGFQRMIKSHFGEEMEQRAIMMFSLLDTIAELQKQIGDDKFGEYAVFGLMNLPASKRDLGVIDYLMQQATTE